ncbi:MAG: trigger factor [Tannerella sp.]|jgi:trigger factor|nr:trigger factor [Tannerella sp.]
MNISHENNDATSGIIKLEIEENDYEAQVEKNLRQYRQKATVPGFRKGMVPMGIIKKMYGKYVLAEEINNIVSEKLSGYIRDNDIKIIGQPIPARKEEQPVDFETKKSFEICFDIALYPDINVNLTKQDKLTYYQVSVDDEMLNKQINAYRKNSGTYDAVDDIEATDMVKGVVVELEDGNIKEEGILVENAVLMPAYIKDEKEQAKFIGAKLGDVIVFNVQEAYQGAAAEIASFLSIDKETVADITSDFRFEVKEITRHKEAELNQKLFDELFGKDNVTSEETFREKVKDLLIEQLQPQSEYKFLMDIRTLLIQKAGAVQFADDILKRGLAATNENSTPEIVEKNYPQMLEDLKFNLVSSQIIEANNLKPEEADLENYAKQLAKSQLAQYGMYFVPEETLAGYAKDVLKNAESVENIVNRVTEQKLMTWVKEKTDVTTKEVSLEEFEKLFA